MTDVKSAKDALVASLFELSKAAQDAAGATVNFYKATSQEGNAESLNNLANTLNAIAANVDSPATDSKSAIAAPNGEAAATDASVDKKKKKKVARDPNAPKKPITKYFAYLFHTREEIREERKRKGLPALSAVEVNNIVRERWETISKEEKAKWENKYADEMKEYKKVMADYKAGLAELEAKKEELEKSSSDSEVPEEETKAIEPPVSTESSKKKEKKRKSEKGDKEKKEKKSKK